MREKESRRGVPLRAGVGIAAVAATVVAGMALANPASAATLGLTPGSTSAFTNTTTTFSLSNVTAATAYTIKVSEPATSVYPITAANPLTLVSQDTAAAGAVTAPSGNNFTSTVAVANTTAGGTQTFTVKSTLPGSVAITVTQGAATASGTLTEVAGAADADHDVSNLAVTPSSVTQYKGESPLPKYTVTATGAGGVAVAGATVNAKVFDSTGAPAAGAAVTVAAGTNDGQYVATVTAAPSAASGTFTVRAWVDNAATGTAGTYDIGDTTTTSTWKLDAAPAITNLAVTSTLDSADQQSGKAVTVPFVVTSTPSSGTGITGAKVALDVTLPGQSAPTRYQGTIGSDGTATVNVAVPAGNAINGGSITAAPYISESSTVADGIPAGGGLTYTADAAVNFAAPTIGISAPTKVQAVAGGNVTIPVTVQDQFGNAAGAGDTLNYKIASGSRNAPTADVTGSTSVASNGKATITYKDNGTGTSGTDAITITDVNHPGYTSASVTASFVTSLAPSTIAWTGALPDHTAAVVGDKTQFGYQVIVKNSDGTALFNVPVTFNVGNGFVSDATNAAATATSVTINTDTSGDATAYVGSEKIGTQTLTASSGAAPAITTDFGTPAVPTIKYAAAQVSKVAISGPKTILPGDTARFTATSTDKFGNPVSGDTITWAHTGTGVPTSGTTMTDANGQTYQLVTTASNESGAGTVTATDTNGVVDPGTGLKPNATAKYTVSTVTFIAVDGANGAKPGTAEKVAVHVYPAAAVAVTVNVSGANSASGVVMTGTDGRGSFFYTPSKAGTDVAVATAAGVSGSTTITVASPTPPPSAKPDQVPTMGAVSKTAGTVNIAVQTHPTVTARKIKLYYVHKVRGHKATLVYAGSAMTNGKGRAHAVLKFAAGSTVVLKARMAGSDYVEHLSNRVPVTVK